MIHFIFSGEEDYKCWGYKISIEEAIRVVRRIEEFLEKQENVWELTLDIMHKEEEVLFPTSMKMISEEEFQSLLIS